jgi:hypothetical protein
VIRVYGGRWFSVKRPAPPQLVGLDATALASAAADEIRPTPVTT